MTTILIDDDPFALKLLMRQLLNLGCEDMTSFPTVSEALSFLDLHFESVTLIFCDLQMPDMDGVQLIRHLGTMRYHGALVLVSGEEQRILHSVQKLAIAHSIDIIAALPKPVQRNQLQEVLVLHRQRNGVVRRPADRAFAANELEQAIAGGQLVNHYQPKVEFATGKLVGVEALVRWNHPEAGMVFPDSFIPLAEEHGLINALTTAVLRASLQQARTWRDAGLDLQMSVNVSMDNLAVLDFPEQVSRLAADAGIGLSRILLEVTESRLMRDQRTPLDILTRLRLRRIGIAIDDFGTGHSSLVQLRDIPFTELKLDKSFVHGAADDPALAAIVVATLGMARVLGIKSVGEGVENLADWTFLESHGCDVAQGYFVARPMPANAIPGWNATWRAPLSKKSPVLT